MSPSTMFRRLAFAVLLMATAFAAAPAPAELARGIEIVSLN